MTKEQAKQLLAKYNAGHCTNEEKICIERWYEKLNEHELDVSQEEIETIGTEMKGILSGFNGLSHNIKLWALIAAVASFCLLAIGVLSFYYRADEHTLRNRMVQDIAPGSSKATLILPDGTTLELDGKKNGVRLNSSRISYIDGTPIQGKVGKLSGNTIITTPKGGEYQIVLSDGTKVWLNAASTLTFAPSFKERGEEKRLVTLSGEAYFEVFKDGYRPFVVRTQHQDVLVLGTHFNVNAYQANIAIKTTLLEGSVNVISRNRKGTITSYVLKPGEQAICANFMTLIKKVNVELEVAWKNGNLEFENSDLQTVMATIERWYNVDVIFQGQPVDTRFTGSVSRSRSLSEVLNFLESTGSVHFKIEGRRVTVMN